MNEKQIIKFSGEYAEKEGISLNKDKKHLEIIAKGLKKNEDKYGYRFCPCRIVTGDFEKDRSIICPCIYHKDEIKQDGHCRCQLFFGGFIRQHCLRKPKEKSVTGCCQ